jgi:uncharacterized iron-regulated membrane protein
MRIIPPQVKIGILIFLFLLILSLSGANYYQYQQIQHKNETILKQKVKVDSLEEANLAWSKEIDRIRADYDRSQREMLYLSQVVGSLRTERDDAIEKLEKNKKRKSVVLAKPKLIEKMSNKATYKLFEDIQCATGKIESCGGKL